jgi:predicted DNA-binding protein
MAVSVRMDPLLEKQLEQEARRKGITKSQFIIEAVERALGRRNPYDLMVQLQAEEERRAYGPDATPQDRQAAEAFAKEQEPYETDAARARLIDYLKKKHGLGGAG